MLPFEGQSMSDAINRIRKENTRKLPTPVIGVQNQQLISCKKLQKSWKLVTNIFWNKIKVYILLLFQVADSEYTTIKYLYQTYLALKPIWLDSSPFVTCLKSFRWCLTFRKHCFHNWIICIRCQLKWRHGRIGYWEVIKINKGVQLTVRDCAVWMHNFAPPPDSSPANARRIYYSKSHF